MLCPDGECNWRRHPVEFLPVNLDDLVGCVHWIGGAADELECWLSVSGASFLFTYYYWNNLVLSIVMFLTTPKRTQTVGISFLLFSVCLLLLMGCSHVVWQQLKSSLERRNDEGTTSAATDRTTVKVKQTRLVRSRVLKMLRKSM